MTEPRVIAWDTETRGLAWFDESQRAFLATWADEQGEYCADLSIPAQAAQFREALEGADVLVAHNAKFDIHHVREACGFDPSVGKEVHDTDLMSRVLYPEGQLAGQRGGHGLKNLAKVFLRADAGDPEQAIKDMAKQIGLRTIKQTGAYYDVWRAFPDVMEEYARQDARYTFDLYQKFSSSISDLNRVYELERQVLPVLLRAEERGVRVDQAVVQELKARYTAERAEVYAYLEAELGAEALSGAGSEQALIEALLSLGVPLHRKTPSGQIATNKYALQEFEKDFEQLAKLEEYRRLERFLSTYIAAVDGRDVVHPSFRQCGAWTGRMSCSSPNLQNVPKRAGKEVRGVFVPREGMAFIVADYESIEAKLLAYYLGDDDYRQLLTSGHDPHAWMAASIWGGEPDQYAKGTDGEKQRDAAKNTTYAIVYGAGAPRVSDMNNISRAEAKALISKIKTSLPNFYKLQWRIRDKIEKLGYVNTLIGRKNPVNRDKAYVGLSGLIQGSAADLMKLGLVAADKAIRPLGGHVLLVVHDEVVCEVPLERAAECQALVDRALVSAWPLDPPLTVESCVVTTSYADA